MESCLMVCLGCGEKLHYFAGETKTCSCGRELSIDKGIESLVIALNNVGVYTEKCCEGHYGFDDGIRTYPWVTVLNGCLDKAELIIAIYNERCGQPLNQEWVISSEPTTVGPRWFLKPKNTHRSLDKLCNEARNLARFVSNFSLGDS